jgi:hypothetical protein
MHVKRTALPLGVGARQALAVGGLADAVVEFDGGRIRGVARSRTVEAPDGFGIDLEGRQAHRSTPRAAPAERAWTWSTRRATSASLSTVGAVAFCRAAQTLSKASTGTAARGT